MTQHLKVIDATFMAAQLPKTGSYVYTVRDLTVGLNTPPLEIKSETPVVDFGDYTAKFGLWQVEAKYEGADGAVVGMPVLSNTLEVAPLLVDVKLPATLAIGLVDVVV